MTELETAVARWADAFRRARISRHPTVWVGHFRGSEMLAGISATRPKKESAAVFYLATPFGYSDDVTDSFVVVDHDHTLEVTQLSSDGRGVRTIGWLIPYQINDYGEPVFEVATKAENRWMGRLADSVGWKRLQPQSAPFDDILGVAIQLTEQYA